MPDHFAMEENLQKVMSATGEFTPAICCSFVSNHPIHLIEDTIIVASDESRRDSLPDSLSDSHSDSSYQDSEVTHEPIQQRYDKPSYSRFRQVASKTVVSFGPNDPENPVNWKKVWTFNPLKQHSNSLVTRTKFFRRRRC